MNHQELTVPIPDHPVMMVTNRDFRLSSMSGFVVNFQANVPARVPPACFAEAVSVGAIIAPEEAKKPEPVREEPKPLVDPSVAEAARLDQEAKITYVEQAIITLMNKSDNSDDFRADGYPKHASVIAVLAQQSSKPTATEVQEIFDDMRENVQYAELFGG